MTWRKRTAGAGCNAGGLIVSDSVMCDELDLHLVGRDDHTESLEHVRECLRGKDRLALVAALIATNHQAVADEWNRLHALQRRHVLHAHRAQRSDSDRWHHRRLHFRRRRRLRRGAT